MNKYVAVIKNIDKTFVTKKGQAIHALQNVSLKIKNNDFVCLVAVGMWEIYLVKNNCRVRTGQYRNCSFSRATSDKTG